MAQQIPGFKYGILDANVDLSAKQFFGVIVDTNGKIALAGAGVAIDGVLQNKPEQYHSATVMKDGISKAVSGGTIALGDDLSTDANGKLIASTSGDHIIAKALEAGAVDNVVTVLLGYRGVAP